MSKKLSDTINSSVGRKLFSQHRTLLIYLLLVVSVLLVFWQVSECEFVNYDDNVYMIENPHVNRGISLESVVWAFTQPHCSMWHPLASLSHMLDCELFGLNPSWHHLTNLLFHTASTLLLFGILKRGTGVVWPGAFVAAAFALHPLNVESIAWIAERKNVLSAFFWMLTIAVYIRYAQRPNVVRFLLLVLVFSLTIMAKPFVVTLPFVLLLLDYWPLGRFKWHRQDGTGKLAKSVWHLVAEKIPLFILSAILSVITYLAQQQGGVMEEGRKFSLVVRIANALVSYAGYIGRMFWPRRLAVFYPHPGDTVSIQAAVVGAVLLVVVSVFVFRLGRRYKYLPVGWLWYLGTLVPVIGLVQVGNQAMADRYAYLPLIGLFIIVAWGAADLPARWRYRKMVLGVSAAAVLLALGICSRLQLRYWRNTIALFEHTLAVTDNNYMAHFCLIAPLREQGKFDQANKHNREALRIKPDWAKAHNAMGDALLESGRVNEAIGYLTEALRLRPNFAAAHNNIGVAFNRRNEIDKAIAHCARAVQIAPERADTHYNLGIALMRKGRLNDAIGCWLETVRLDPDNHRARNNLGTAFYQQGRIDLAIAHWKEAARLNPDDPMVHNNLGEVLAAQGRLDEAITEYREVLRIDPGHASARRRLDAALTKRSKAGQ